MSMNDYVSEEFVSLFSSAGFQDALKGYVKYLVKEDKEFRHEIKCLVLDDVKPVIKQEIKEYHDSPEFLSQLDSSLSNVDIFCQVPRRLMDLEIAVGIRDCDPEEIHKHAVPERIISIEKKLSGVNVGTTENPSIELKLKTKTGRRAFYLIKKLKASGKDHLTHREIKAALSEELPEEDRIDSNTQNPRKAIIDVIKEAAKLCSDVLPDKKKAGHKEYRLILNS